MPRKRRHWCPGAGSHVISRFVDRQHYIADAADRQLLLHAIGRGNARWDWQWLSFALMSSHVHYGLIAGQSNPDRFFRSAHTRFAQAYHRRRQCRTLGPVFAERPSTHVVRQAMLLRMVAYHHRNPIEAGVVGKASESNWTSHRAYLHLDPPPPWLDVSRAFELLGFEDSASGRKQFDEFVMETDLTGYVATIESPPEPCTRREPKRIDWDRLIALGWELAGVPDGVPTNSRKRAAAAARVAVAQVATRDLGQSPATAATQLGVKTGSLYNSLNRIEGTAEVDLLVAEIHRRFSLKR